MGTTRTWPAVAATAALFAVGLLLLWNVPSGAQTTPPLLTGQNALGVIEPYRQAGTWVFDDPRVNLRGEPFVAGVPEMIDLLLQEAQLPARERFRLLFSATEFPGHHLKLQLLRPESGGNWYRVVGRGPTAEPSPPAPAADAAQRPPLPALEGWICPALFRYFTAAPPHLYVKAEAIRAP